MASKTLWVVLSIVILVTIIGIITSVLLSNPTQYKQR